VNRPRAGADVCLVTAGSSRPFRFGSGGSAAGQVARVAPRLVTGVRKRADMAID
jgi:hypothetical protein